MLITRLATSLSMYPFYRSPSSRVLPLAGRITCVLVPSFAMTQIRKHRHFMGCDYLVDPWEDLYRHLSYQIVTGAEAPTAPSGHGQGGIRLLTPFYDV